MRKDKEERLFSSLNNMLAESLEGWKSSPYSERQAAALNATIRLAESAELGIILKINKKSWDNKDISTRIKIKHGTEDESEVIRIDPPKKRTEEVYISAFSSYSTDEYIPSSSEFSIRFQGGIADFQPQEIESIQAL